VRYFRLDRSDYGDRLVKLKAAGANRVATYVPWLLHEPNEGQFDFTTYDLASFLDERARVSLLALRPGPYRNSEPAYHGAYGMKGGNYCVFAGGTNPPGAGVTGDGFDYLYCSKFA
jgi:beta-galactosidase GanA